MRCGRSIIFCLPLFLTLHYTTHSSSAQPIDDEEQHEESRASEVAALKNLLHELRAMEASQPAQEHVQVTQDVERDETLKKKPTHYEPPSGNSGYYVGGTPRNTLKTRDQQTAQLARQYDNRTACGGELTEGFGTINSPNFPENYPANIQCTWSIVAPPDKSIRLTTLSMSIESDTSWFSNTDVVTFDCAYDTLKVYLSRVTTGRPIERFCGGYGPYAEYMTNELSLVFTTDGSTEMSGFSIEYRVVAGRESAQSQPSTSAPAPGPSSQSGASPGQLSERACNGVVDITHSGVTIVSHPQFGAQNYRPNQLCRYSISYPSGSVVEVTFEVFSLEGPAIWTGECGYDSLRVGSDCTAANEASIGSYCGEIIPGPIRSTHNTMCLTFISDRDTEYSGFSAIVQQIGGNTGTDGNDGNDGNDGTSAETSLVDACNKATGPAVITGTAGEFSLPLLSGTATYAPDMECEWEIRVPEGRQMQLMFTQFQVEDYDCAYDYLTLEELDNTGDPTNRVIYCGQVGQGGSFLPPNSTTIHSNRALIKFQSDSADNFGGFTIKWNIVGEGEDIDCKQTPKGTEYQGRTSTTTSGRTCQRWDSTSPHRPSNRVLQLVDTDLADAENYCRNPQNWRTVWCYTTDPRKRWEECDVPLCSATEVDPCSDDRPLVLQQSQGSFALPTLDGKYANNAACKWKIVVPEGKVIRLEFSNFEVEYAATCEYDFVSVKDASEQNRSKYCGTSVSNDDGNYPTVIMSETNKVFVAFKSDGDLQEAGFTAVWSAEDPDDGTGPTSTACDGGVELQRYGNLMSAVDSVGLYSENMDCTWNLVVDANLVVKLKFLRGFDLEESESCAYDYVAAYDGNQDTGNAVLLGKYCGNTQPRPVRSTSNKMTVKFHSDESFQKKGFSAEFDGVVRPITTTARPTTGSGGGVETSVTRRACGDGRPARLTADSGTIFNPTEDDGKYKIDVFCLWRIELPVGRAIRLTFESFNLESQNDIGQCYDSVSTYDGEYEVGLSTSFCGTDTPSPISSSGNVLTVRFWSDGSEVFAGFRASYESIVAPPTTPMPNGGEPLVGGCGRRPPARRIVGGVNSRPHSWPWQVSLQYGDDHFCGGSIISKNWILTAAHCVSHSGVTTSIDYVQVLSGAHKIFTGSDESTRQRRRVLQIISNPGYEPRGEDIALLKLDEDLDLNDEVMPICLPRDLSGDAPAGTNCSITGWGSTDFSPARRKRSAIVKRSPDELQEAFLPILTQQQCNEWLTAGNRGGINDYQMCAGIRQGGYDTCQGDSGGPFVCDPGNDGVWEQFGVTSWGYGCGDAENPGVYARVAASMDFIKTHTLGQYHVQN